jgi:hypothetical protein
MQAIKPSKTTEETNASQYIRALARDTREAVLDLLTLLRSRDETVYWPVDLVDYLIDTLAALRRIEREPLAGEGWVGIYGLVDTPHLEELLALHYEHTRHPESLREEVAAYQKLIDQKLYLLNQAGA